MNTKLTLTLEKSVIEKAKEYAKNSGRSLSEIVENYFKAITAPVVKENFVEEDSAVYKLKGALKGLEDVDYKKVREERLLKKYMK